MMTKEQLAEKLIVLALLIYAQTCHGEPIFAPAQLPPDAIHLSVADTVPVPEPTVLALAGAGVSLLALRFLVKGEK